MLSEDIQDLVVRLVRENPRWKYEKFAAELSRSGISV